MTEKELIRKAVGLTADDKILGLTADEILSGGKAKLKRGHIGAAAVAAAVIAVGSVSWLTRSRLPEPAPHEESAVITSEESSDPEIEREEIYSVPAETTAPDKDSHAVTEESTSKAAAAPPDSPSVVRESSAGVSGRAESSSRVTSHAVTEAPQTDEPSADIPSGDTSKRTDVSSGRDETSRRSDTSSKADTSSRNDTSSKAESSSTADKDSSREASSHAENSMAESSQSDKTDEASPAPDLETEKLKLKAILENSGAEILGNDSGTFDGYIAVKTDPNDGSIALIDSFAAQEDIPKEMILLIPKTESDDGTVCDICEIYRLLYAKLENIGYQAYLRTEGLTTLGKYLSKGELSAGVIYVTIPQDAEEEVEEFMEKERINRSQVILTFL